MTAMVVANRCMHWEEGIVKLKSQLMDTMDANKALSSTVVELTCEKNLLTNELTRAGIEVSMKDEELRRTIESYGKALDQLKALSEQMETAGARAVEEYKSSDACDDNSTKYFLAGFELLRKQANEKYPIWISLSSNHMRMMILLLQWRREMLRWRRLVLN